MPTLQIPCYMTNFCGTQALSTPYAYQVNITAMGNSCPHDFLDQLATITVAMNEKTQHFNGYITKVTQTPSELDEQAYTLTVNSFLYYLDQEPRKRIFENLSIIDIVLKICKDNKYYDLDIKKIAKQYSPIKYIVQYNETDLAFMQRLLVNYGINYYFEHTTDKHYLVLFDNMESLSSLGELRYSNVASNHFDIHAWRHYHNLMPNGITLQCTNSDKSPQIIEHTETNDATLAPKSIMPLHQTHYLHDTYEQEDLKRLVKLQLAYWRCQSNRFSGISNHLKLLPGCYFQLTDFFVSQDNTDYLITDLTFEAHDNSHKTNPHETATYFECQIGCQLFSDGFTKPPILHGPSVEGIQYGITTGRKKKQANTTNVNETPLRHMWDQESTQQQYPNKRYRVASMTASHGYGQEMQPREGSKAILQMINSNPTQTVVVGSVYDKKMPSSFNPQDYPYHHSIKTQTLNTQQLEKSNAFTFVDNPNDEAIIQYAAKDLMTLVTGDANLSTGGNYQLSVNGNNHINVKDDFIHLGSAGITLKAGGSTIHLAAGSMTMTASKITADNE